MKIDLKDFGLKFAVYLATTFVASYFARHVLMFGDLGATLIITILTVIVAMYSQNKK